jgi:hypothetical protein
MQALNGKISAIETAISDIMDACKQANAHSAALENTETDLPTLEQAFGQLIDALNRIESDTRAASTGDVTEIGEYASRLQETLSAITDKLGLSEQKQPLACLSINMALWIADHDGRLESVEAAANAIAQIANSTQDPQQLEQLNSVIARIINAVSALVSEDLEKMNPGRPWRVLLMNYGIVATRSHNAASMEAAFAVLTSKLPEDATGFFSEGMQQMDVLDYPSHVRKVMEKYHREWPLNRSLH